MKTKRKTWYLQKKDILYVEENHDGKYGAKGKERLPKRKLTPEDVQRVNAWNKSKRARLRLMEYFSPGDLWVTFTYKPENRPPDMDTAKKQFLKMMDKLRKIYRKKGRVLFWIRNIERGTKGAWHIHCIINDIGNTASLVERAWPYGGVYVTQIRKRISRSWLITSPRMRKPGKRNKTEPWQIQDLVKQTTAIPGICRFQSQSQRS